MSGDLIAIKGVNEGLVIALHNREPWAVLMEELADRIDQKAAFYAGAMVTLDAGERPIAKLELSSLKVLLERRKLFLAVVQSSSQTTLDAATALDVRTRIPPMAEVEPTPESDTRPIDPEEHGTTGVLIRRTLRSGRTVHSRGHVVVYGDVNPGAKIVATGDIIIWGKLRGMVHAGAEGDLDAVVCALDMSPNQLRIADFIATSPDEKNRDRQPEVAVVRDEQIVVESWK